MSSGYLYVREVSHRYNTFSSPQFQIIVDINLQIAVFRDLLIHVGTAKDSSELREKIRRVRRQCVEGCKQTNTALLPQIKR